MILQLQGDYHNTAGKSSSSSQRICSNTVKQWTSLNKSCDMNVAKVCFSWLGLDTDGCLPYSRIGNVVVWAEAGEATGRFMPFWTMTGDVRDTDRRTTLELLSKFFFLFPGKHRTPRSDIWNRQSIYNLTRKRVCGNFAVYNPLSRMKIYLIWMRTYPTTWKCKQIYAMILFKYANQCEYFKRICKDMQTNLCDDFNQICKSMRWF